ncbi:MAG TPA: PAS domain S-box protein [Stenomitos sp.]
MVPGSKDLNDSPFAIQLQRFSQNISLVVVLIGFAVIGGWVFDIAVFTSILPPLPTMKVNTAVGLLLGGTSLWLWHWEFNRKKANRTGIIQRFSFSGACFLVLLALLTLIQYGFNVNLGIDQGLMQQPEPLGSTASPGRMAPNTALAFLFEGLALLLLSLPRPHYLAVQGMALGAGILGFLGLLGYVYGSTAFSTAGSFTGMAIHTAIAFLLLSSGILGACPDRGIMLVVNSDSVGSLMARRLLPLAIVLPPLLGGLSHLGYHWHLYTEEVQAALANTFDILLFSGLIGWNSYMLNRLDSHRRRAERSLQTLNAQLQEELHIRKQAEEALQTSQARFAGILEIASDAVISVDERQRIILFNQGSEKVFGYATSEVLGQPLDLLLPMRFAEVHHQYVSDFAQSPGKARRMAERSQIFGRRKDGTEFPAEASISKLNVGGKIVFTAFLRDISEAYRQAEQRQRTEETLRESEERFRSAFDNAAIGMALVGIEGRWLKVNRSLCDLVGYSEQELLSLSFQDITHPEDMEADLSYARQLLAGEIRSYQLEKRYFHAHGHVIWILLSGSLVRDIKGNPLYFIAQIQDITERKQAEKLLALQAVVVKNMAGGVCLIRATDNTIVYANPKFETLFGYDQGELNGKPVYVINYEQPDQSAEETALAIIDQLHQYGEATYDVHNVKKDGTPFWCRAHTSVFEHPEYGTVYVAVQEDITEFKRAEQALRESEERFRAIFNQTFQFVGLLKPDGTLLEANQTALDFGGITRSQVIHQPFWEARWWTISAETQEQLKAAIARAAEGEFVRYEVDVLGEGDRVVTIDFSLRPIFDDAGTVKLLIPEGRDISDRKLVELEIIRNRDEREAIFNESTDAIFLVNAETTLTVDCNRRAVELFEASSKDELIGTEGQTLQKYPFTSDELAAIVEEINTQGFWSREIEYVTKTGKTFWGNLAAKQITVAGKRMNLVRVTDVSARKETEEALKQSERLFRILAEISPVGIFRSDASGQTIYANERACQLVGAQLEEVLGWQWSSYIHPQDQERVAQAWQSSVAEQLPWQLEYRLLNSEGKVTWVLTQADLEQDDTDTVIGYVGTLTDISDRKASEEALKQSESTLRSFFNSTSMLMGIVELHDDDILHISDNQVTAQLFGTTSEAMQNRFASDLGVPPASIQMWMTHYRQAEQLQAPVQFEYPHQTPHGERWLSASVCPIAVSPSGHPRFSYIVQDITQRKQAEESLRRYERIVSATTDSMCLMDRNYTYQLVNQAYLTLHNKRADEIIGHSVQEILGKEVFETLLKPRLDQCLAGEVVNYQMWLDYSTIGRQFIGITYAPYCEADNTISGLVVSIRNLTDLKQVELELQRAKEAAEVANRAKSLFLASMSHELRTPLNVMLGFTQVMNRDSSLTLEQRESLQIISRSGHHLLALINDVLDLSKIEAGRLTLDESSFDLLHLLRSLRDMFNQKAESRGLQLYLEIASDVPQYVNSDPNKLRQVLINLLSNAIKFTHKGSVSLNVNRNNYQEMTGLMFAVSDTGVGIAPNEMNHIFDAFVQAQAGKVAPEGTGLGLAISRKFVQLMGGDITVSSILGEGSTFKFEIPVRLALASEVTPTQYQRQVIGLAPGQPPYRILVADDQAENRQLLVKLLTPLGLEVQEAQNGEEAVMLWQQWQPHLIWMDIRMPQMDGYEATQRIRSSVDGQATIIIALTAHVSSSDRTLALSAGCNDFISKPFQVETLFAKMAEYLGLRYVYAQNDLPSVTSHDDDQPPAQADILTAQNLSVMPLDWITQLHQAAQLCDDEEIFHLIEQIPAEQAPLIARLRQLAHDFQFQPIVKLTQTDSRLSSP